MSNVPVQPFKGRVSSKNLTFATHGESENIGIQDAK